MSKVLQGFVALPALLFTLIGLRWAIDPAGAAGALGMPLLEGIGRSSQIGDVGTLFFTMGLMIFIALFTNKVSWIYPPALILGVIALFRVIAWLFHGADLAAPMIAVEVIVASLLLFASTRLTSKTAEA